MVYADQVSNVADVFWNKYATQLQFVPENGASKLMKNWNTQQRWR
jgi:hypothetical protein